MSISSDFVEIATTEEVQAAIAAANAHVLSLVQQQSMPSAEKLGCMEDRLQQLEEGQLQLLSFVKQQVQEAQEMKEQVMQQLKQMQVTQQEMQQQAHPGQARQRLQWAVSALGLYASRSKREYRHRDAGAIAYNTSLNFPVYIQGGERLGAYDCNYWRRDPEAIETTRKFCVYDGDGVLDQLSKILSLFLDGNNAVLEHRGCLSPPPASPGQALSEDWKMHGQKYVVEVPPVQPPADAAPAPAGVWPFNSKPSPPPPQPPSPPPAPAHVDGEAIGSDGCWEYRLVPGDAGGAGDLVKVVTDLGCAAYHAKLVAAVELLTGERPVMVEPPKAGGKYTMVCPPAFKLFK